MENIFKRVQFVDYLGENRPIYDIITDIVPTPSVTPTVSVTPSISVSPSIGASVTPTISITPSITPTLTPTPSLTPGLIVPPESFTLTTNNAFWNNRTFTPVRPMITANYLTLSCTTNIMFFTATTLMCWSYATYLNFYGPFEYYMETPPLNWDCGDVYSGYTRGASGLNTWTMVLGTDGNRYPKAETQVRGAYTYTITYNYPA